MTDGTSVLVATDLSGMAFLAARKAAAIARAHGATLELLHVVESFATAWADAHLARSSATSALAIPAEEALAATVCAVCNEYSVRANGIVVEGKPAVEIAGRGETVDAGVIVVGASGVNAAAGSLGATAERVLARSRRPVLLVKKRTLPDSLEGPGIYSRIQVATERSPGAAAAARIARDLFPEATLLEGLATRTPADLIVLASEHASPLRRFALGKLGIDTIVSAECDVLVVRTVPGVP